MSGGATPHSRSGGAAERRYPSFKVRSKQLHFAGSAVKRYPVGPYMGNLKKKGGLAFAVGSQDGVWRKK